MTVVVIEDDVVNALGEEFCGFVALALARCVIAAVPRDVLLGIGLKDYLSPAIKYYP